LPNHFEQENQQQKNVLNKNTLTVTSNRPSYAAPHDSNL